MPDEEVQDDSDKSDWNAGQYTVYRIHQIKQYIEAMSMTDDYRYCQSLQIYFKEILPMMAQKERMYYYARWDMSRDILKRIKTKTNDEHDIDCLHEWECELRIIEQDKNMNLPKQADSRFALGRR